uniref:Uncharacterized protein n=1 Tax=Anguilla anguilla TaxID=7936 RepID=A0A0E9QMA2_ANGAN
MYISLFIYKLFKHRISCYSKLQVLGGMWVKILLNQLNLMISPSNLDLCSCLIGQ